MTVRDPTEIEAVERNIIRLHDTAQLGDDGSLAEGCAPIAEAEVHTAFAHLELAAVALRRASLWQAQFLTDNRHLTYRRDL